MYNCFNYYLLCIDIIYIYIIIITYFRLCIVIVVVIFPGSRFDQPLTGASFAATVHL